MKEQLLYSKERTKWASRSLVIRDCFMAGFRRTLKGMEVHFTPEQETQLSQIANRAGTDVEGLVKDAALRLLQEEARFRAAVQEGIAQADRGEFIEEEEMDARLEQMLRS
jgi:predicted transcriptional regulator